jgi:5'-3' exonuclease
MKLLLVDGLNLVRRIFSAIPGLSEAEVSAEHQAQIAQSSAQSLRRALKKHSPSHCVAVFENRAETWRHRLLPQYKQNRSPVPKLLIAAMPHIKAEFLKSGVSSYQLAGYEADDIIATCATRIAQYQGHSVILSTDRLYCQLLSKHIQVYDHFGECFLDEESVLKKFFTSPDKIADVMGLAGDSSLSIPGVKSVGIKTAARLVNEYGNLRSVLDNVSSIPGALGKNLRAGRDDAELSYRLFQLRTDVELDVNLKNFRLVNDLE